VYLNSCQALHLILVSLTLSTITIITVFLVPVVGPIGFCFSLATHISKRTNSSQPLSILLTYIKNWGVGVWDELIDYERVANSSSDTQKSGVIFIHKNPGTRFFFER
jgi:hypothetical protein